MIAQSAHAPLDLTSIPFVTGNATTFAGGKTATSGTNTVATRGDVDPHAAPGREGGTASGPDLSSPVDLNDDAWSCPWPSEAEDQEIDHELVALRVWVRENGQAESVQVEKDPGHGFAAAAIRCALETRFKPAHDRAGRPVRARSPLIRVKFTR